MTERIDWDDDDPFGLMTDDAGQEFSFLHLIGSPDPGMAEDKKDATDNREPVMSLENVLEGLEWEGFFTDFPDEKKGGNDEVHAQLRSRIRIFEDDNRRLRNKEYAATRRAESLEIRVARLEAENKRLRGMTGLMSRLEAWAETPRDCPNRTSRMALLLSKDFATDEKHLALRRKMVNHIDSVLWPEHSSAGQGQDAVHADALRLRVMDMVMVTQAALKACREILGEIRLCQINSRNLEGLSDSLAVHVALAENRHLHEALMRLAETHPAFDRDVADRQVRKALTGSGKPATIRSVLGMTPAEVFRMKGIGKVSYRRLLDELDEIGIPNIHSISDKIVNEATSGDPADISTMSMSKHVLETLQGVFRRGKRENIQSILWDSLETRFGSVVTRLHNGADVAGDLLPVPSGWPFSEDSL